MQRRTLWLIATVVGGAAAFLGVGLAGLTLVVGAVMEEGLPSATQVLLAAGIAAQALILGLPLAFQGWSAWRGQPARPFAIPHGWWLFVAWVAVVLVGAMIGQQPLAVVWLPLCHVLGMALPPLALLWLAGRGLGGTWREVSAGLAGGGMLGVVCALGLEMLAMLIVVLAVTLGIVLTPGGVERIAALVQSLEATAWLEDSAALGRAVRSPAVVVGALALLALVVPLIEELVKTLAIGVAARWLRPRPAQAFLWGLASGAGFALAESLSNGALGGTEGWAAGAASRVAAAVMHCFTGGLMGWGWGQCWSARKPWRLVASYAVAVGVHGLWNGLSVSAGLLALARGVSDDLMSLASSPEVLVPVGLLGVMCVVFTLLLIWAGSRLAWQEQAERAAANSSPAQ